MSTSPEAPQTIRNYLERLRIDQEPLWDHQRAGIYRIYTVYTLIHKNIHSSTFYNNRLHIHIYIYMNTVILKPGEVYLLAYTIYACGFGTRSRSPVYLQYQQTF